MFYFGTNVPPGAVSGVSVQTGGPPVSRSDSDWTLPAVFLRSDVASLSPLSQAPPVASPLTETRPGRRARRSLSLGDAPRVPSYRRQQRLGVCREKGGPASPAPGFINAEVPEPVSDPVTA